MNPELSEFPGFGSCLLVSPLYHFNAPFVRASLVDEGVI